MCAAMAAPVLAYENLGLIQGSGWLFRGLDLFVAPRDRLALIGRNGAGKTTLLKCLADMIETDEGRRTIQPGIKVVLLEQDPQVESFASLRDFTAAGPDAPPPYEVDAIASQIGIDLDRPAATASGGERRRAAIARALAQDPDVLLLDEPTNHLDLETLDLLQEVIADYDGTVLIVSHDRDFLDKTVTITLGLDGSGDVDIVVGGYEDWVRQRKAQPTRSPAKGGAQASAAPGPRPAPGSRGKLTYKDQRDYELLPRRVEELEAAIARDEAALADPNLYTSDPQRFAALMKAIESAQAERAAAEERWLDLAEQVEALAT
jgi:ATP-binding cassette subfamily F protein uup